MIFKYSQYPAPGGKSIYRPSISIMFKRGSRFILLEALVDSGADHTILPIEIAGELDLKLDKRTKSIFYGAGGNPFTVYRSQVKLECIIRQAGFRSYNWKSFVYFAESQPTILLGNKGFLDQFKVTLNGIKREVEIKK